MGIKLFVRARDSHTEDTKLVFLFKQTAKSNWIKQNQVKTKSSVTPIHKIQRMAQLYLHQDVPQLHFVAHPTAGHE